MFCTKCGKSNTETNSFCTGCGAGLKKGMQNTPHTSGNVPVFQDLTGQIIDGKYKLTAKIGAGGMGDVYQANRIIFGDEAAIKVLHLTQSQNQLAVQRFLHEAKTSAKFKHTNAVAIYDIGTTPQGSPYLVMELVQGKNLRQLLREKKTIPLDLIVTIAMQTCSALDEAHRLGIVHRDIKPENIVLSKTATGWQVKVLDFGIAKVQGENDTNLTLPGNAMGTPQYMSPEQCLGEPLDSRSDIYSFGIVLYEMLCGTVPFYSPVSSAVVVRQVNEKPKPPADENEEISENISNIVLKALEKERNNRPKTAGTLAREFLQAVSAKMKEDKESSQQVVTEKSNPTQSVAENSDSEIFDGASKEFNEPKQNDKKSDVEELSVSDNKTSEPSNKIEEKIAENIDESEFHSDQSSKEFVKEILTDSEMETVYESSESKIENSDSVDGINQLNYESNEPLPLAQENRKSETERLFSELENAVSEAVQDLNLEHKEAEKVDFNLENEKTEKVDFNLETEEIRNVGNPDFFNFSDIQTSKIEPDKNPEFEESAIAEKDETENFQPDFVGKTVLTVGTAIETNTNPDIDESSVANSESDSTLFSLSEEQEEKKFPFISVVAGLVILSVAAFSIWLFSGNETSDEKTPNPVNQTLKIPEGMVYVPGGEFLMGNNNGDKYEKPAFKTSVKPFFIDIYEVTCADYKKFMEATGYKQPLNWKSREIPSGWEKRPVTGVNWDDANAYAKWAGKRLPTEAEWEFAARGTDGRIYPWGNEWKDGMANANLVNQGFTNVGSYKGKSPFGAFDMIGNAWEWTADDAKYYKGGKTIDSNTKTLSPKVIRGGFYENPKEKATVTFRRFWGARDEKDYDAAGFRCVKD